MAHKYNQIFFSIVALVFFSLAHADETQGVGHAVVMNQTHHPWFSLSKVKKPSSDGHIIYEITFTSGEGELWSKELVTLSAKGDLQSYHWQQNQTLEHADMNIVGDTLQFSYAKAGEKLKTSSETLSASELKQLVFPPLIADFLLSHWDELVAAAEKKEQVEMLIAAPNQLNTFRFYVVKDEQKSADTVTWVLKPKNFFVSIVVSPIKFVFNLKHKLLAVNGSLPPVKYRDSAGVLVDKTTDIIFSELP